MGELVQELDASQPTISKHLKVLREADLVSMRAQGQKRYYALNPKPLAGIASWLETFDVGPRLPRTSPDAAPQAASRSPNALPRRRNSRPACRAARRGRPAAAVPPRRPPAAAARRSLGAAGTRRQPAEPRRRHSRWEPPPSDDTMPQQIGRTVGRAATKAADLLANLPKFGRKK